MSKKTLAQAKMIATAIDTNSGTLNIDLYGDIGIWGITLSELSSCINGAATSYSDICLNLYSPGGDFNEGMAIYHYLKNLGTPTVCNIQGLCASAATLVALGCDVVKIPASAAFMIHEASVQYACGTAEEMELASTCLATLNATAVQVYKDKTNLSTQQIQEMMSVETTMSGTTAVELGFCDQIQDFTDSQSDQDLNNTISVPDTTNTDCLDGQDIDEPDLVNILSQISHAKMESQRAYIMKYSNDAKNSKGNKKDIVQPVEVVNKEEEGTTTDKDVTQPGEKNDAVSNDSKPTEDIADNVNNEESVVVQMLKICGGDMKTSLKMVEKKLGYEEAKKYVAMRKKISNVLTEAKNFCPGITLNESDFDNIETIDDADKLILKNMADISNSTIIDSVPKMAQHNKTNQNYHEQENNYRRVGNKVSFSFNTYKH